MHMIRLILFFITISIGFIAVISFRNPELLPYVAFIFSIILLTHSLFTLFWMLYAWENPKNSSKHASPKVFKTPFYSFSLLIPARREENVIEATIRSMAAIDYPDHLKEVLILIREDDVATSVLAKSAISYSKGNNIRVVTFGGYPINKPHALNIGLKQAKNDIVVVFDAEDDPHKDILNVANTILMTESPDVIQSGVQLMNYDSRWFSLLNVLEYFFWFKSGLLFFSKIGKTTPLGGNTVFFKRWLLNRANGWREDCLTEDAEIGLRLSLMGAKIKVIYDAVHTTREETPVRVADFIRQRTRWNLGFLQVVGYGDWLRLGGFKKKIFSFYILFSPFLQALVLLSVPFFVRVAFVYDLPFLISFFAFLPLYVFILQLATWIFGSLEFCKSYSIAYPYSFPFRILFTFFFYQILLVYASIRALMRYFTNNFKWEKTYHANSHRSTWGRRKLMYDFT